ncbi:MAG: PQQ-binding-like beta-propeller repeat protein [Gemmataceae bacterium]|nr:PQQ-binding-like beta-propeller repeat protein [Gemmataceae bacterium]
MIRRLAGVACLVWAGWLSSAGADDWPGFRGGSGGVAPSQDVPTHASQDSILWKVKLPGPGTSSPIVSGDKLFVTAYSGYGTTISKGKGGFGGFGKGNFGKGGFGKGGFGKGGFGKGGSGTGGPPDTAQKKLKLLVVCLNRDGGVAWQKEIEPKLPEVNFTGMIREHGYASSTPVADGERVIAFFGKSGVFAFDYQGKQLWRADVGPGTHMMGTAASPVLYKDLVIVNASIESQALVALDKRTGKEVWRAKGVSACWASPILVTTSAGAVELVVNLPGKVAGYRPESGKELWHCQGIGTPGGYGGTSSTPVARDGIVYAMGGGGTSPPVALAVKTGGSGDVTKSHVLWRQRAGGSYCSPVIVGDKLCWVDGTLQCLGVGDGKSIHKERLYDARGEYVSAVAAGDTIFALTRSDGLFVLDAAKKFDTLSRVEFDGDDSLFNASPAVSAGRLYLRSNAYLYCLGKR